MMDLKILTIFLFFTTSLVLDRTANAADTWEVSATESEECTMDAFYDSLGQSESDGCGGGNQYNCIGPVITSGMHKGDTPLGKYQFMPKTLRGMGIDPDNFVGNAAAQEAAIRQFVGQNDACLESKGAYNHLGETVNGVTITKSCLLGAAHLGGCGGAANWVNSGGSSGPSDQLGTSLADYCGKFTGYGDGLQECGGGVPNAADIFGQSLQLLGCDPDVLENTEAIVNAANQAAMEAVDAIVTQPQPAEVATCADQYLKQAESIANTASQNQSGTIAGKVQSVTGAQLSSFLESANITGSVASVITSTYSTVASAFESLTGGITSSLGLDSALASSNCDMINNAWLIQDCIAMPEIPNLNDILSGTLAEITGAVDGLANPDRLKEMVCSQASDLLGDAAGDLNSAFDDAATAISTPITDSVDDIGL